MAKSNTFDKAKFVTFTNDFVASQFYFERPPQNIVSKTFKKGDTVFAKFQVDFGMNEHLVADGFDVTNAPLSTQSLPTPMSNEPIVRPIKTNTDTPSASPDSISKERLAELNARQSTDLRKGYIKIASAISAPIIIGYFIGGKRGAKIGGGLVGGYLLAIYAYYVIKK